MYHRGGEIVDDQVAGHPAEEDPGGFQPGDDVGQLLKVHEPEEAVPGMAHHDAHGLHQLAASRRWVRNQAPPAEVCLHHLTQLHTTHPPSTPGTLPTVQGGTAPTPGP